MPETARVVVVPEAEPLVSDWRAQHDWSAQRGVPTHITLLYPFVPTEKVDDEVIPHLTVAEGGVGLQDQVEAALSGHLPIRARADDVAFLFEDDEGRWHEAHRFPLAG